jgi:hypothetical protein
LKTSTSVSGARTAPLSAGRTGPHLSGLFTEEEREASDFRSALDEDVGFFSDRRRVLNCEPGFEINRTSLPSVPWSRVAIKISTRFQGSSKGYTTTRIRCKIAQVLNATLKHKTPPQFDAQVAKTQKT